MKLLRHDYNVAWIAPGPEAVDAAILMLDEEHDRPDNVSDVYKYGSMAGHNIVIATPAPGKRMNVNIAMLTAPMGIPFPNIKTKLLVGIGGGVPSSIPASDALLDIHLGDVVVGWTTDGKPPVVYYDSGIHGTDSFEAHDFVPGPDDKASLKVLSYLLSEQRQNANNQTKFEDHIKKLHEKSARSGRERQYQHPGLEHDKLFRAEYRHPDGSEGCIECDTEKLVKRKPRSEKHVHHFVFHTGRIATGNSVIKDGERREAINKQYNGTVRCIEGSAAGAEGCLVIRGISDYCDSHKDYASSRWKNYAAGRAAVFAKELLSRVPPAHRVSSVEMGRMATLGRDTLLKSLHVRQPRQTDIENATQGTGHWILDEYRKFIAQQSMETSSSTPLWIKGMAGSGKSTLMKLLVHNAYTKDSDEVIRIAFFFNARGEDSEKTVLGMFKSLLHQLINHKLARELLPEDSSFFINAWNIPSNLTEQYQWSIGELRNLFRATIAALSSVQIHCFIDALDEGIDCTEIKDMVNFMVSIRPANLKLCFASRPYMKLSLPGTKELELDKLAKHNQDISIYIRTALQIDDEKKAQDLQKQILRKASGIFLWARLVVERLNQDYEANPNSDLAETVHSLPRDLGKRFMDGLWRGAPVSKELVLCFQLLLFSCKTLQSEQLYQAITSVIHKETFVKSQQRTKNQIESYLSKLTRGLTEALDNDRVQFIHESVRDYLLRDDGILEFEPRLTHNISGLSHAKLSQVCRDYFIRVDDISQANLKGAHTPMKFAFLDYSLRFALQHSDTAASYGIRQNNFLQAFPFSNWVEQTYNCLYSDPANSSKMWGPFLRKPLDHIGSELHILAALDLSHLLINHLANNPESRLSMIAHGADGKSTTRPSPLTLAFQGESKHAISAFFDFELKQLECSSSSYAKLLKVRDSFCESYLTPVPCQLNTGNFRDWEPKWIKYFSHFDSHGSQGNYKPLALAAIQAHPGLLLFLIQDGLLGHGDLVYQDEASQNLLHAAVLAMGEWTGDQDSMEAFRTFLSEVATARTVDVNAKDRQGSTSLHLAAYLEYSIKPHPVLFCLLDTMACVNVNAQDENGRTALHIAARYGNTNAVEVLLRADRYMNGTCRPDMLQPDLAELSGRTALHFAAGEANDDIVRLLLQDVRVNVNTTDNSGSTALIHAVKAKLGEYRIGKRECTVDVLLKDDRVDVNQQDKQGQTALHHSICFSSVNTIRLLLRHEGLDPNRRNGLGQTPLHLAALNLRSDHRQTVIGQLLEDPRVDVTIKSKDGKTFLDVLSGRDKVKWARKLREKGHKTTILRPMIFLDDAQKHIESSVVWLPRLVRRRSANHQE